MTWLPSRCIGAVALVYPIVGSLGVWEKLGGQEEGYRGGCSGLHPKEDRVLNQLVHCAAVAGLYYLMPTQQYSPGVDVGRVV